MLRRVVAVAAAAAALRPTSLGYDLAFSKDAGALAALPPLSRDVLGDAATEPAGRGETACGLSFEQLRPIFRERRPAVFATALGGLPVFSSDDALDRAVTKLHGAFKMHFLYAQRGAGVFLIISAKFWI